MGIEDRLNGVSRVARRLREDMAAYLNIIAAPGQSLGRRVTLLENGGDMMRQSTGD